MSRRTVTLGISSSASFLISATVETMCFVGWTTTLIGGGSGLGGSGTGGPLSIGPKTGGFGTSRSRKYHTPPPTRATATTPMIVSISVDRPFGFSGSTTTSGGSFGDLKIGNRQLGLQHFTSLPACDGAMKPTVSHIGHLTSMVRPLPAFTLTWVADLLASGSTSNGSLVSSSRSGSGSRVGRVRPAPPAGAFSGVGLLVAGAPGFAAPGAGDLVGPAAGFGAGLAPGLPDIDAPQNGHSATSSSRTDALQDGQLRNSMRMLSRRCRVEWENFRRRRPPTSLPTRQSEI